MSGYLTNLGTYADQFPVFFPGPAADVDAQDVAADDRLILVTMWPGGGLDMEQYFDRAGVQLRTAGKPLNYSDGEQLAQDCDRAMLSIDHSQFVNGKWTLAITRAGGAPTLIQKDDGDRYQFYCNYIWEVEY